MDREIKVSKCLDKRMKTRVQLNSKTFEIDVYKQMPSIEEAKRYALKIEQLTIPDKAMVLF